MPSKAFSQANLLGTDNTLQATSLSADIPITELYANIDELPASGTLGEQAFVQSTNRLYIWNGSGWYNIALINTTPTWDSGGQPAASYELDADSPQTSTTITLAASDPEGIPITYSYIQSGQMDSMATISQDSSVFTITPKTISEVGEGVSLTGNITFRASDGINILPQVSSFTLNFVTAIENSRYTTLLATATDTSDNNNITDSSSNNHSITVNGDAHAGTFSPYRSGGYSTYFDGNGDYLQNSDGTGAGEVGSGAFCIEAWVYKESNGSFDCVCSLGTGARSYQFEAGNGGNLVQWEDNSGSVLSSTTTLNLNQWYHVAVSRDSSNNIRLYVNGTKEDQAVRAEDYNDAGPFEIARNRGATQEYHGYIRDLRIVVGNPVYTADTITVPTDPLTAITNTNLLACHLPYIADGSNNNWALNVNGNNVATKPFSPYDYEEYSSTDHGGSVYFDGSGDYLLINSPPTLGANDWTFETWYYASNPLAAYNKLLSQGPGNNTIVSAFSISNTGEIWLQTYTTSNVILYNTAAGIIKGGTWNHIVLTHDYDGSNGGTYKIYVNGNQVGSNVSYTSGYYWNSGGIAGTPLAMAQYRYNTQANDECYFSDWKISSGVTYSSNFTPPTAPLSSSGAELHIKGTDASIIDKSQVSNLKLVGSVGSTTQVKFPNTKSMHFDGSGDYIAIPTNELFGFSTNDFTVEFWVYFNDVSNAQSIYSNLDTASGLQPHLYVYQSSVRYYTQGADRITSSSVATGQWYHVALSRSSSSTKLFLNGTQSGSTYSDGNDYGQSKPLGIATYWNSGSPVGTQTLGGYIQDLRVTKGLARYTANFTPPTASLEG